MALIKMIGKPGSKACKEIRTGCGIYRYTGKKKGQKLPDALVNYGLAGGAIEKLFKKYPSARKLPIVNRKVGYSKLTAVRKAEDHGIWVPESKVSLGKSDKVKDFIEKRYNSIGGKGIRAASKKARMASKYYQRFIRNRRYEIRVHAFKWLSQDSWAVQKRYGAEGEIAWNFSNGGHFVTVQNPGSYKTFVEAREISDKVLDILGMSFGAVDFLVDTDYNVYFIEINSAPGFSELSKPIYLHAFGKLKEASAAEVRNYAK